MVSKALISASITGVFCAIFALILARLAPQLTMNQVLAASFISGFFGSLVARFVTKK